MASSTVQQSQSGYMSFMTSLQMEASQILRGDLRVLRTNEDDLSEAAYRRRVYDAYSKAVEVLDTTTDRAFIAGKAFEAHLDLLSSDLESYFALLEGVEIYPLSLPPSQCLEGTKRITINLKKSMVQHFEKSFSWIVDNLFDDHRAVHEAFEELCETMDSSSMDGILDPNECLKLQSELWNRGAELGRCLEKVREGLQEAQDWVKDLSVAAVDYLREGRLAAEEDFEEVCEEVMDVGDLVTEYDFAGMRHQEIDEEDSEEDEEES